LLNLLLNGLSLIGNILLLDGLAQSRQDIVGGQCCFFLQGSSFGVFIGFVLFLGRINEWIIKGVFKGYGSFGG
jgi:hypothetical protein